MLCFGHMDFQLLLKHSVTEACPQDTGALLLEWLDHGIVLSPSDYSPISTRAILIREHTRDNKHTTWLKGDKQCNGNKAALYC